MAVQSSAERLRVNVSTIGGVPDLPDKVGLWTVLKADVVVFTLSSGDEISF